MELGTPWSWSEGHYLGISCLVLLFKCTNIRSINHVQLSTSTRILVLKPAEKGPIAAFEAADKVEFQPSHPGYPKPHPSPEPRQVSNYPSWICGNEVYLTLVRFMSNVQLPLFLSVSASGRRLRPRGEWQRGARVPEIPKAESPRRASRGRGSCEAGERPGGLWEAPKWERMRRTSGRQR